MQRLWQAALLVPIAGGILQTMPSRAATLDTENVQFQAVTNGASCSFEDLTTPGKLGINPAKNLIGTETADGGIIGGTRASYSVVTNFTNAKINISNPLAKLNGSGYSPQVTTLFISRNGGGEITSTSGDATLASLPFGGDTVNIGLTFTPSSQEPEPVFEEGSFTAELTATCTD